jgi:hypothetical protein
MKNGFELFCYTLDLLLIENSTFILADIKIIVTAFSYQNKSFETHKKY